MGQSNSIESIKPFEPIESIGSNEWTNYMEWTHYKNLKKVTNLKEERLIIIFIMIHGHINNIYTIFVM